VVRRLPYSNTSQIVHVFGRDEGIFTLLAKGALRPPRRSSSFPTPFDLLGWYDIGYRVGRGEIRLATEARLVEGFDHLRRDLSAHVEACLALEVISRMFSPNDPYPEFLRGTLSYLKLLGVPQGRRPLRIHLYSSLLRETGLAPSWEECVDCGGWIGDETGAVRPPEGIVCGRCRRGGETPVEPPVAAYLASEAGTAWGRVPALAPPSGVLHGAWRALLTVLLYHLERPPRTLRYLRE
jgi:DNA repair protein RecO (recombination protein O)